MPSLLHVITPCARRLAVVGAVLASVAAPLAAQHQVSLPSTEQFTVKSKTTGVEYRIDAWIPPGLDTMKVRPSVFYITDGNVFLPMMALTYQALNLGGGLPPLIFVGVGYPDTLSGMSPFIMASRTRDYTPTRAPGAMWDSAGKGGDFLGFLKGELIPLVESRYRADSSMRGLGGHSFGGLFSTYVLLHEPTLFSRWWIGSPSLWWDAKVPFTWLPTAAKRAQQPAGRAFVTVGSDESDVMVPPMKELSAKLRTIFPSLHVGSRVYEGETHTSVIGGAMASALRFLYGDLGRPSIALTPLQRAGFVGKWKAPSGAELIIARSPAGMTVTIETSGQQLSAPLFAESKDVLYSRAAPLNIAAERDARGAIVRVRSTIAGPEEVFERVKK